MDDPKFSVIIVGAGAAGLNALKNLTVDSRLQVSCFEASDYIGGRARTRYEDTEDGRKIPSEFGAAWIHGEHYESKLNPVLELARELGISLIATPDMACVRSDGTSPDFSGTSINFFEHVWKIIHELEKHPYICQMASGLVEDMDAMQFLCNHRLELFGNVGGSYVSDVIRVLRQFQNNYGTIYENMSASAWSIMKEYHGDHSLLTEGYSELFDRFVKKYNLSEKIKLQHKVLSVERVSETGQRFKVRVLNRNDVVEEYFSDYVVMAAPLGVLKAGSIELGAGLLPDEAFEAIKKTGFGKFEKVFVDYDCDLNAKVWPINGIDYLIVTPSDCHDVNAISMGNEYSCSGAKFVSYYERDYNEVGMEIINLKSLYNINRLVVLFYDKHAEDVARLSAAQNWEGLKAFINPILKKAFNITMDISRVQGTDWAVNELFRGSFSYIPPGCNLNVLSNFARMYDGFMFAGEHTDSAGMSTVHGALESGAYVASKILEHVDDSSR